MNLQEVGPGPPRPSLVLTVREGQDLFLIAFVYFRFSFHDQKVTPRLLDILKRSSEIQSTYVLSDSVGSTLSPYGVIMLIGKEIPISSLQVHHISTSMARKYVCAEVRGADGSLLHIGTVHMESMGGNTVTRIAQIREIFGDKGVSYGANHESTTTSISRSKDHIDGSHADDSSKAGGIVKTGGACAAIVTGDFNFDPRHIEEEHLPGCFLDAWTCASKVEADDGAATSPDGVGRIDRVMVYNDEGGGDTRAMTVRATDIRRIGTKNIEGVFVVVNPGVKKTHASDVNDVIQVETNDVIQVENNDVIQVETNDVIQVETNDVIPWVCCIPFFFASHRIHDKKNRSRLSGIGSLWNRVRLCGRTRKSCYDSKIRFNRALGSGSGLTELLGKFGTTFQIFRNQNRKKG